MLDKVQITISAYNFQKLCDLHDLWLKAGSMAEQDINYMIGRILSQDKQNLLVIKKYIENESKIRGIIDKKYSQHIMISEIKKVISNAK
jgi:hypothetical protein